MIKNINKFDFIKYQIKNKKLSMKAIPDESYFIGKENLEIENLEIENLEIKNLYTELKLLDIDIENFIKNIDDMDELLKFTYQWESDIYKNLFSSHKDKDTFSYLDTLLYLTKFLKSIRKKIKNKMKQNV